MQKSLTLWHTINLGTVGFRQIINKSWLTNFHTAAMKTKREIVFQAVMQLLSNKVLQALIQEFYACSVSHLYSEMRQEGRCIQSIL